MNSSKWLPQIFRSLRMLIVVLLIYVVISGLQTLHQKQNVSLHNVEMVTFPIYPVRLCVRYPNYLTYDGDQQAGTVSLRLLDSLTTATCDSQNALAPSLQSSPAATVPITGPIALTVTTPAVYTFTLVTSPTLTFVDQAGESFAPLIALRANDERSVTIRHAQLSGGSSPGQVRILESQSGIKGAPAIPVRLEDSFWGLSWRKFRNIVLAPAGIIAALGLVVIQELRKIEDQRKDAAQKGIKFLIDQAKSIQNHPDDVALFSSIRRWVNFVQTALPDLQIDLEIKSNLDDAINNVTKKYLFCVLKYLQHFENDDCDEWECLEQLADFAQSNWDIDNVLKHRLFDLKREVEAHLEQTPTEPRTFVDPELTGFHANLAWIREDNRSELLQQIATLKQFEQPNFFDDLIVGVGASELLLQKNFPVAMTLFRMLKEDFITETVSTKYMVIFPWQELRLAFKDYLQNSTLFAQEWHQLQQDEASHMRSMQRIATGLKPVRVLWPIDTLNTSDTRQNDANFDFPSDAVVIDDEGIIPNYQVSSSSNKAVSAYDLCTDYLSKESHYLVVGKHFAGKTWLRRYLEHYLLSISGPDEPLIAFYFPPAILAYIPETTELIISIARSISNQLFANLLLNSSANQADDSWRFQCAALAQFFQQYNYRVPTDNSPLPQPTPAKHILDLDLAYRSSYQSVLYAQMKQEIERTPMKPVPAEQLTTEQILGDIQRALELTGYRNIVLLVDNWDHLSSAPRNRILTLLLKPDLLSQLQEHKIILKFFMPDDIDKELFKPFKHSCTVERHDHNGSPRRMELYSYS